MRPYQLILLMAAMFVVGLAVGFNVKRSMNQKAVRYSFEAGVLCGRRVQSEHPYLNAADSYAEAAKLWAETKPANRGPEGVVSAPLDSEMEDTDGGRWKNTESGWRFLGPYRLNPADSTTYSIPLARFNERRKVKRVSFNIDCWVGSKEPVDFCLMQNATELKSHSLPMFAKMEMAFSDLDHDVSKDDRLELKIVTPAWLTNPVDWKLHSFRVDEEKPK